MKRFARRLPSLIITFLLFFLPFVVWPLGYSQFEVPKVIITEICIAFLIFSSIYLEHRKFFKSFNKTLIILLGAVFALSLFHLFFLPTHITFLGNSSRLQGVFLLWNLLAFCFVSSKISLLKLSSNLYLAILFITFILTLLIGNQSGRGVATLGEPNALASFVIFLWPFILFSILKNKFRLPFQLLTITTVLGIILLTGSRSGLIAFAVQIIFYIAYRIFKLPFRMATVIAIIAMVLSFLLPTLEHNIYENRLEIWNTAVVAGFGHTILGSGFGNAEIAIKETSLMLSNRLGGYYVDSAHNIFLDWWVQGGFVGLTLLMILIYNSIKNFCRQTKELEIIILVGLLTALSFNPASIVGLIAFWWVISKGFARVKNS